MKFIFIPANTGEQNGCSSGTRSDKQKGNSYMCIWIFFFSSSLALFEIPRGDRFYCLCTVRRSRKWMPQVVKSIRLRNRGCGLIMQKGNRIAVEWEDWAISTNFFA